MRNPHDRIRIGSTYIDNLSFSAVAKRVEQMLCKPAPSARSIVPVNAQLVEMAHERADFADVLAEADLVVPDGMSIVFAARVLGTQLPGRIAGVDLMVRICEIAAGNGKSVYLLGGREGAAEETARRLIALYPTLKISGVDCPPFGFEKDADQSRRVLEKIQRVAPDILFIGLGAPKQEFWMSRHSKVLPVNVIMVVGGSFDMLAGQTSRAPVWMQNAGLEWLFRLYREPSRLWRRYLLGNTRFILLILRQSLRKKRR